MIKFAIVLGTLLIPSLAAWTGFHFAGQADQVPSDWSDIVLESRAWAESPDIVTFAVIGDAGTGSTDQFRVARQMAETYREQPYRRLLTVGDNVYGGDVVDKADDVIFKPYMPLFDAGVEFNPSLGNHDLDDLDDLPETLETLEIPNRYYQFTDGPVAFFALDSNWTDSGQLNWLRKALICSDSRWQVVYMHHPPYSSGKHGSDTYLRQSLEPILIEGGADLVLSGHDHDYERSTPQNGIVYVVTGGGSKVRPVGSSDFTAVSQSVLHFLMATVAGNTMDIQAVDVDGNVIDAFSIAPRPSIASCGDGRETTRITGDS